MTALDRSIEIKAMRLPTLKQWEEAEIKRRYDFLEKNGLYEKGYTLSDIHWELIRRSRDA